ncbi:hypothetical protein VTK73DRAFT_4040 [Phialemonium thermophilum]|uniref:Uncharacterized protein n=1 Tax=Phialemonium thermophilum TaxID=223376 RepID=A0ABR3VDE7_9PEZI
MVHLTSRINKVFHRINSKLSRSENKGTAQVATGAASGRQTTAQSEPNETPLEGQTLPQQTASPAAIPPEPSPRPSDSHPKPGAEPALDPPTAVSQAEGAAICQPPAPVVTMKTVQPRVASAVEPKDPQSIVITIPFRSDRTTTAEYLAATATRLPSADLGPSSSSSSPAVFSGANSPTMDTDAETDSSSGSDSSDDDPMDVDEMPPPTTSSESASASADGLSSSPPPVSRPRHGQTVAEWSDELRQATCPACTKPLFLHGAAVVAHTAQALREGRALQPYITCPKCRTTACVYCGAVPALAYPVFRGASMGPSVSWCCDKGRLFLAWMLCCDDQDEAEGSQAVDFESDFVHVRRLVYACRSPALVGRQTGRHPPLGGPLYYYYYEFAVGQRLERAAPRRLGQEQGQGEGEGEG